MSETHEYRPAKWTDERGGNMLPNSNQKTSENPTLFNVVYHFLLEKYFDYEVMATIAVLHDLIEAKWVTNGGKYMTNEYDDDDSFSLDESIAVAAACARYPNYQQSEENLAKLKIWTKSTWFRFYDVVPYLLLCKYWWAHCLIVPQILVMFFMVLGCYGDENKTSGKQIAFVEYMGLEHWFWMRWTFKLCEKLVPGGYRYVFKVYYPEKDHPHNQLAREIWGEEKEMGHVKYQMATSIIMGALFAFLLTGCEPKRSTPAPKPEPIEVPVEQEAPKPETKEEEPVLGKKVQLWATMYYKKVLEASETGVPLRDMNGKVIGPKLSNKNWCLAAIEGTVRVGEVTYNYAGKTGSSQADCGWKWRSSEKVRWLVSKYKFGLGNRNNPLIPFYSLACDQSIYLFGQEIYIPAAKGSLLPNGEKHDGLFRCDDVGGAIKGNHIDVFIGSVEGGLQEAIKVNPFPFIKSSSSATFDAFLVK